MARKRLLRWSIAIVPLGLVILFIYSYNLTWTAIAPPPEESLKLDEIQLPEGFQIRLYARVPGARSMALHSDGTLFVGSRGDRVFAVAPGSDRNRGGEVFTIASGLNQPNGVALREGDLYVAEISRVVRYPDIGSQIRNPPSPELVTDRFPSEEHHGWKYIAFGPDGYLYVPVGAPCNVCKSEDPIFASITRIRPDGTGFEIFATGIRNTVGFDWHPETAVLWFTNNGRDWMGDDQPPDSLERAPNSGLDFGFPYCHAGLPDPEFEGPEPCSSYAGPMLELPAHVAALGMTFYTGKMFPEEYADRVFIAEHGSWNRTVPIGYRVTTARIREGKASDYSVFASGWLRDGSAWGRPVDVIETPEGALLVSDDRAGAIYRIACE